MFQRHKLDPYNIISYTFIEITLNTFKLHEYIIGIILKRNKQLKIFLHLVNRQYNIKIHKIISL